MLSVEDRSSSPQAVCVCVCGVSDSVGRDSLGWRLLHYFLGAFLPCIIVHVGPSVIISKAAVETKGRATMSGSLLLWRNIPPTLPASPVIYDVIVSTFPLCITGEAKQASA